MDTRPSRPPFGPAGLEGFSRDERRETDAVRLHGLCSATRGGPTGPMAPAMALALAAGFGGVGRWREGFMALGQTCGGESGWVLTSFLPHEGRLVNQWAADPTEALAGGVPVLALHLCRHAGEPDVGTGVAACVDDFVRDIGWAGVHERYQDAVRHASDGLGVGADALAGAVVLDVRRDEVFHRSEVLVDGARWLDPASVDDWAGGLPRDRTVVVYCVHGHEVSRATALRLRACGVDARFLDGGLEAWQAQGRPLASRVGRR